MKGGTKMDIKNDIIEIAKGDPTIRKFTYWKKFFDKWEIILKTSYKSNLAYTIHDINDKDQCYTYSLPFGDHTIDFHFSIKYFREYLNYCRKTDFPIIKISLNNINGKLKHGEFQCRYTKCDTFLKPSFSYNDLEDVLAIPMPVGEYGFLIVDGNHRICSQINENKDTITVTYLDYKIATNSLNTPFEIAFYCFIEDFQKLRHNIGKIQDDKFYKILNINNPKGNLSIITKRENQFINK